MTTTQQCFWAGVDLFTVATCKVEKFGAEISVKGQWIITGTTYHLSPSLTASECVSDHGKATCREIGGQCITERDGYYLVSGLCITFGLIFFVAVIIPTARKLQGERIFSFKFLPWLIFHLPPALPVAEWRVKM